MSFSLAVQAGALRALSHRRLTEAAGQPVMPLTWTRFSPQSGHL